MLYFYNTPKNKRKENNKVTNEQEIKKKDILYYAQILPKVGIYNVCEMIVCTLYEDYFACMDKREKKRYLFYYSDIDKILFANRLEALTLVTDAEKKINQKLVMNDSMKKIKKEVMNNWDTLQQNIRANID